MPWSVEYVEEFGEWLGSIPEKNQDQIVAAILLLQRDGPALRRPKVGKIESSRHANMKELIPPGGNVRILFAFDPDRKAILLVGGDKTNRWKEWYRVNIPLADDRYDRHLLQRARGRTRTEAIGGNETD
jgi:hypothetical protein